MIMALRSVSAVSLILGGVLAILFGAFWNLANYSDELPRCSIGGCSKIALQYYWSVFEASTLIVIAEVIVIILGVRLDLREPKSLGKNNDCELTSSQMRK
jgi:hypothetical protein